MKYFFVVGEHSGDMHASCLFKHLQQVDENAEGVGWGGTLMHQSGIRVLRHYKTYTSIGFVKVALSLPKYAFLIKRCLDDIKRESPDAVVLVDFPGFNLTLAKHLKGVLKIYYIMPQIWAWNTSRVKILKKHIDYIIPVLPFEGPFLEKYGIKHYSYYGHPLSYITGLPPPDEIIKTKNRFRSEKGIPPDKKIVTVFPGSRTSEIKYIFPVLRQIMYLWDDIYWVVGTTPHLAPHIHQQIKDINGEIMTDNYMALKVGDAGIIKSGTSTLEAGIMNLPQVVVYRGNSLSYIIARMVAKVKYISLVNLILDKHLIKELIQGDCNPSTIIEELHRIIYEPDYTNHILSGYAELRRKIGDTTTLNKIGEKIYNIILEHRKKHITGGNR